MIGTGLGISRTSVLFRPRLTNHGDNAVLADIGPGRFVRLQQNRLGTSAADRPQLDLALEHVCPADARLIDLDAELRAEVGDHGGGSANGEEGRGERGEGRGGRMIADC